MNGPKWMGLILAALLFVTFVLLRVDYESVTVTDFSQPVVLHANTESNVVLLMNMKTNLNQPVTFQLFAGERKHYEFTVSESGVRKFSIDWYSPELELVFVDAESVSGSMEIDYSF